MDPQILWQQWPIAAGLIWFITAIGRRQWIPKGHHEEIVNNLKEQIKDVKEQVAKTEKSEEEWKNLALKGTNLAVEAVEVARSPS